MPPLNEYIEKWVRDIFIPLHARDKPMRTLPKVMQALYDSEINVSVSCFWDGGWDVKLGDEMNGWNASGNFDDLGEAADWLTEQAKKCYPESVFAKNAY